MDSLPAKHSTEFSCSLRMEYEDKDLKVKMHAYSHGMGNGSCSATVSYKGKKVYAASGSFRASPHNTITTVYIPGAWEKKIAIQ